jgi:hypothetical protein
VIGQFLVPFLTGNRIDCSGQKGDVNEEKTNSNPWTNRNVFTTGGYSLCFLSESKRFPTPGINASSADLGKFSIPL